MRRPSRNPQSAIRHPNATASMPPPSADDLAQFLLLDEERRDLERQARLRETAAKRLKELLTNYCRSRGGRVALHGHVLEIEQKPGQPNWRELYVRDVGVGAADQAMSAAAPRERLLVHAEGAP
jgi:hypothetical protein